MATEVEYRPIPGFAAYRAGSDGSLWSCLKALGTGLRGNVTKVDTGRPRRKLKPDVRAVDQRKRYTLRADDGTYVRKYGSYFILLALVGPKPEGKEACHDNGDCTDDSSGNLRWDTPIGNKADMLLHKTRARGENHPKAKLTDQQAFDIKIRHAAGETAKALAYEHHVSTTAIYYILKGKRHTCLK